MIKKMSQFSGALLVSLIVGGCASQPAIPVSYFTLEKEVKAVNSSATRMTVSNGAVILPNGEKIYDEEGDVLTAFTVNGNGYYLLKNLSNGTYSVKDKNKKIIKTFQVSEIAWFFDGAQPFFAVRLSGNSSSIYDNVYSFDGQNFKVVNKNIYVAPQRSGIYSLEPTFGSLGYFKAKITNIITSEEVSPMAQYPKYKTPTMYILGAVGSKVVYVYKDSHGDDTIEVYDPQTKVYYPLLNDSKKIQLLRGNNDIVIKVFQSDAVHIESKNDNYTSYESKYKNEPATYISISKLKEVAINESEYNPIFLHSYFDNMGGGRTPTTLLTFDTNVLALYMWKNAEGQRYSPIF
ncbi:MAG: hypothetical protein NT103_00920 [Campylobacterales bacterium]|nr:hypothetical protein [Campylobacterales bacterium]